MWVENRRSACGSQHSATHSHLAIKKQERNPIGSEAMPESFKRLTGRMPIADSRAPSDREARIYR
jgi:hypothetical protein